MSANDMSSGVICTDVNVTIGADKILNNVNLHAEPGTITGLIGSNGSGKTMLLRAICGLVPLTSGSIVASGQRVGTDVDFPDNIGAIIETPGFLPQYSALENLRILAKIRARIGDGEIKAALKQVGLGGINKRIGKYSLGMKQRLGIAQAIMENPDILLLDEPMNGLDKSGVNDMRELFKTLREQGKTILLASHNPLDIEELCDTVYEMDGGVLSKIK
jgi:ABC-2 type transport system ATP-binding protein